MLRKCQLRTSLISALAGVVLALPTCAHAGSAPKVTTTLRVALTGSFFLNTGDQSTSEWIDFSGDVQLVIRAIPPDPIRVHANMAGATGIGRTSGRRFILNGSENFEADGDVPNTLNFEGEYRLIPPYPIIPPDPIMPVNFTVQVDGNGIASSELASVGECTTDLSCGN